MLSTGERLRKVRGLTNLSVDEADELVEEASQAFCKIAEREFAYVEEHTELVKGFGRVHLVLTRTPVLSVDSVTYQGSVIDPGSYFVSDSELGLLTKTSGYWPWTAPTTKFIQDTRRAGQERALISVVYSSGYVTRGQATGGLPMTLPREIERAVLDYAVTLYRGGGRDRSVASRTVPRGSVAFRDDGYPAGFKELAESYRLPGPL